MYQRHAGLYAQGRYQEVLHFAEKALGLEHPAVAMSLNNLAEFYRAQGKYAEAETAYRGGANVGV